MIYFTSDQHFGHEAIIGYCDRPYKNADKMDNALIKNWNKTVAEGDTVYVVGDVTLKGSSHKEWLKNIVTRLNGQKHLVLGNHDAMKPFTYVDIGFWTVHTALRVRCEDIGDVTLVHDPAVATVDRKELFLCGHVHDLYKKAYNTINVGVDVWDYCPVSTLQIQGTYLEGKKYQ